MSQEHHQRIENIIKKLEKFQKPKNVLLLFYRDAFRNQLRNELELNESTFLRKDINKDDLERLQHRDQKIRSAAAELKSQGSKQISEFNLLKVAAIYFDCPIILSHKSTRGESLPSFINEPDLFSLTNLVTTLEPLADQKDADSQFVKYFSKLKQKKSQILLDESLVNKQRLGMVGIVKDYLPFYPIAREKDKKRLKVALENDIRYFLNNTNTEETPNVRKSLVNILGKITKKNYVIGADEITEYVNLIKSNKQFKANRQLTRIDGIIHDTREFNFDSVRTKKTQEKMGYTLLLTGIAPIVGGATSAILESRQKSYLSQPDHDPLRPLQALNSTIGLGQQLLDHRGDDPAKTALTYLQDSTNVRPVASYLLYDYFETLNNFPEKDRERLVGKATYFITHASKLYSSKGDPSHQELIKYLSETAQDPEMEKLLSYTILPFSVYIAEQEDVAREQILAELKNHWENKEYFKMIPQLNKLFKILKNYDPDNIKIDFDNPSIIHTYSGNIQIPESVQDQLNSLPQNPNFLPLPEFFSEIQANYEQQWREVYGDESLPPKPYRTLSKDITHEKTAELIKKYLNQTINNQKENGQGRVDDVAWSFTQENGDWFTDSVISSGLYNIKEIYDKIPINDPYREKFINGEAILTYYKDYIHFIKSHGTPDKPMLESKLFGYALLKCNGNYSDALKEMSVLYKFLARYDLETGDSNHMQKQLKGGESGSQTFFRTRFLRENLPVLQSISSETSLLSDPSDILKSLPKGLMDQTISLNSGNFSPLDIGGKEVDIDDLWGGPYHRIAALALTVYTTQNPSLVGLGHTINEFPMKMDRSSFIIRASEQGSTKLADIILSDTRNIAFSDEISTSIPIKSEAKKTIFPTIYVISESAGGKIGQVMNINPSVSSVVLPDLDNKGKTLLYYGPPNIIRLLAKNGYAPANFVKEVPESIVATSPEVLDFYLNSGVSLPSAYDLNNYPAETQLEIAKVLLKHHISVMDTPYNLGGYLRLGVNIPSSDIDKLISNPKYYKNITDALPFLSEKGLISFDHPLVAYTMKNDSQTTFDYFSNLSSDDQSTLKKIYSNLEKNMVDHTIDVLLNMNYEDFALLNKGQIDNYFNFLLVGLHGDKRETVIREINLILPHLSADQMEGLIQNKNLKKNDLFEIFQTYRINFAGDGSNTDIVKKLKQIELIVSDRPDLLLDIAPSLIEEGVWKLTESQEKIDNLMLKNIEDGHFQLLVTDSLYFLMEQGYKPSPEIINKLVVESMAFIKNPNVNYTQMGQETSFIFSNLATPDQFNTAIKYLVNSKTPDVFVFINQLIEERFRKLDHDNSIRVINKNEIDLFNDLMSNDKVLSYFSEKGILTSYYNYENYYAESNAIRLYKLRESTLSEIDRYRLTDNMKKHNFHPPTYVFNHDKFVKELNQNDGRDAFIVFYSSSNDFVRQNLTFTEYIDIYQSVIKTHNFFDLYLANDADIINVFNHEYFKTIPGYTPELEKNLVQSLIDQLSSVDKNNISVGVFYMAPYLISQRPDFDYGPYFYSWVMKDGEEFKYRIGEDQENMFLQIANNISQEYWNMIKANDIEKYNYLMNIISSQKK